MGLLLISDPAGRIRAFIDLNRCDTGMRPGNQPHSAQRFSSQ